MFSGYFFGNYMISEYGGKLVYFFELENYYCINFYKVFKMKRVLC